MKFLLLLFVWLVSTRFITEIYYLRNKCEHPRFGLIYEASKCQSSLFKFHELNQTHGIYESFEESKCQNLKSRDIINYKCNGDKSYLQSSSLPKQFLNESGFFYRYSDKGCNFINQEIIYFTNSDYRMVFVSSPNYCIIITYDPSEKVMNWDRYSADCVENKSHIFRSRMNQCTFHPLFNNTYFEFFRE